MSTATAESRIAIHSCGLSSSPARSRFIAIFAPLLRMRTNQSATCKASCTIPMPGFSCCFGAGPLMKSTRYCSASCIRSSMPAERAGTPSRATIVSTRTPKILPIAMINI